MDVIGLLRIGVVISLEHEYIVQELIDFVNYLAEMFLANMDDHLRKAYMDLCPSLIITDLNIF